MKRDNLDDPARHVVEEPKRSLWPALMIAVVVAAFVLAVMPNISRLGSKIGRIFPYQVGSDPGPHQARGDVRTVFSADDYPADAQARGQEGTVQAQLAIDTAGHVTNCTVIRSSGTRSLDQATCRILQSRAQFRPARDAAGHAVPDTVVTPPVTWRLED